MPPKITIITVNYNMADGLAKTIANVTGQTWPNLEYVVIDGGSTDNSVEVVRRHAGRIAHWVSERDRGIYDAMNKGVAAATGDWIIFMNAGDVFYDAGVVSDVFAQDLDDADVVYGDMMRRYSKEDVERLVPAHPVSALPLRMPCCHQSMFARRELLLDLPFSGDLSIVADHEFVLRAWLKGARFQKLNRVIGIFSTGGASDNDRLQAMRQLLVVLRRHGVLTPVLRLHHAVMLARALAGSLLKFLFPRRVRKWILENKPPS
jgi:putative colanic acid biosynthesis glycosyltransferase